MRIACVELEFVFGMIVWVGIVSDIRIDFKINIIKIGLKKRL